MNTVGIAKCSVLQLNYFLIGNGIYDFPGVSYAPIPDELVFQVTKVWSSRMMTTTLYWHQLKVYVIIDFLVACVTAFIGRPQCVNVNIIAKFLLAALQSILDWLCCEHCLKVNRLTVLFWSFTKVMTAMSLQY